MHGHQTSCSWHHSYFKLPAVRVLPTLDSVDTTQELRNVPAIVSKESLGVIPIVTLGLRLSYPNGDDTSISVELNEESLERLR